MIESLRSRRGASDGDGCGATAVNAWLAQETFQARLEAGRYPGRTLRDICLNYKHAIEAGLMKILAKKGISIISALRSDSF